MAWALVVFVEIQSKDGTTVVNLNRRRAIRERCLNCSGWSVAEVRFCSFADCPLYPFRMGKGKQDARERARAIRAYCAWCMAGNVREVGKCTVRTCPLFPYRQTTTDRSVELAALPQKAHIEPSFEAIFENVRN